MLNLLNLSLSDVLKRILIFKIFLPFLQGRGRGLHWAFIVVCGLALAAAQVLNCLVAHEVLVPQPGIQPSSPALEGRSLTLDHWEVPKIAFRSTFYFSHCTVLSVYLLLCSSWCNCITEMMFKFYFKFFVKFSLITSFLSFSILDSLSQRLPFASLLSVHSGILHLSSHLLFVGMSFHVPPRSWGIYSSPHSLC